MLKTKFWILQSIVTFLICLQSETPVALAFDTNSQNKSVPTNDQFDINSLDKEENDASHAVSDRSREKVTLVIRLTVPHNVSPHDWCRIYPYPVAPPKRKDPISPLPIKTKDLSMQLQGMGYVSPSHKEKPYPSGGWRMQYAYKAALAKSGLGEPHTIFTMYSWIEEMVPYMRRETMRLNEKEKEREDRYQAAQKMFDANRTDLEMQALNKGLFPMDIPLTRKQFTQTREGKAEVAKANWWIVALHQVPGLKYYWLWPVKLNDSPEQIVDLNEDNAIFIEGGW